MKKIIPLLLMLALFLCIRPVAAEDTGILGKPFPDFTATDTEGNTFTLSEALKDHDAVLVNIWATWCPPCRLEFPFLSQAYEEYGDRVAFISLSCEETDTIEKIEEFRTQNGISVPMGRDEGRELFRYTRTRTIPVTVIVDRFGNAVYSHGKCFKSSREITSVLDAFLGDDYTETTVLDSIPKDNSTAVFPVGPGRKVIVENENAREIFLDLESQSERPTAYVVNDSTAHLSFELPASEDPYNMVCYIQTVDSISLHELASLLDPESGRYVLDVPMPEAGDQVHIVSVALTNFGGSDDADTIAVYLIPSEEYVDELCRALQTEEYELSEESTGDAAGQDAPQAYILHVVDQNGEPVPGVMVNFCTDTTCTMAKADDDGIITFDGEPDVYHVELLKLPEGYSSDPDFELYTPGSYGEWMLRISADDL